MNGPKSNYYATRTLGELLRPLKPFLRYMESLKPSYLTEGLNLQANSRIGAKSSRSSTSYLHPMTPTLMAIQKSHWSYEELAKKVWKWQAFSHSSGVSQYPQGGRWPLVHSVDVWPLPKDKHPCTKIKLSISELREVGLL